MLVWVGGEVPYKLLLVMGGTKSGMEEGFAEQRWVSRPGRGWDTFEGGWPVGGYGVPIIYFYS